jgi:hypothetical protein
VRLQFGDCVIEWFPEQRLCVTRFADGTCAHAIPHDTPEYHQHAAEKSTDDIDLYCWQHDIAHAVVALMDGRKVSLVLWNLAHGQPVDTPECEREEQQAQAFQKAFFLR